MIGMNENFVISGFSDEIDASTDIQFENLNRLGISYFEPRNIDGKNIATVDIVAKENVKKISFVNMSVRIVESWFKLLR